VWPTLSIKLRKIKLKITREHLELPDGDFIELDWVGKESGPIVIVLHGLDSSSNSHYVQNWLGQEGKSAGIEKAIAVSAPLDLHKVEERVNQGFSRLYQWWFLHGLKNKILEKTNSSLEIPSMGNYENIEIEYM
jgi:predicted alpha/beta-fold hydrolase